MPGNLVVGLDLGFRNTGVVMARPVKKDPGYDILGTTCICTKPEHKKRGVYVAQDDIRCCQEIARNLLDYINEASGDEEVACVIAEAPHGGGKGARALRSMGMATGVLATFVQLGGYPVHWVMPDESKRQVGGSGSASKLDIQAAVLKHFPDVDWPEKPANKWEHIADAAAALLVGRRSDIYKFMV